MMLLTLIVFAALRYDVGWDYMNYYNYADDEGSLILARERYSVLWYWLFKTAYDLQMPHLAIAIPAVITYISVYIALSMLLKPDKNSMSDALLVYAFWPFFYLSTFSTIRQSLAIAIGLLIFALLYKRKWIYAIILFALNTMIHPSSILTVLYLPIILTSRRIPIIGVVLIGACAIFAIENWVELIMLLNVESFTEYAETYMENEGRWGYLLSWLLGAIALFIIVNSWRDKKQSGLQNKLSIIVVIAMIVDIYIYQTGIPSVITRTTSYFSIFLIMVFYASLHKLPYPKICRVALTCALVMLFFIYLERTTHSATMFDITTSSFFVPYQTILAHI